MTNPRDIFEALMRGKGFTEFTRKKSGVYANPAMQTRWTHFQLGWEMRGVL